MHFFQQGKVREWTVVTLVCLFLLLVRFYPFLLGKTLFFGDNYSLMVPAKIFSAVTIRAGELPFWNPYLFGGVDWIGDINFSTIYFSTLFFVLFDTVAAFNLTIISHYVVTFVGMYLLIRTYHTKAVSCIGAALWMFSTQFAGATNNLSTLQSMAWFPWIVWAGLHVHASLFRKILFGLLVTVQFLAGYPQHVVYAVVAVVLHSALSTSLFWKQWFVGWVTTGVIVLSMAAIAWLPFAHTLLQSTRMEQTTAQAQTGSLHPVMMIKIILSYAFDNPSKGVKWGPAWSGQPNMVWNISSIGLVVLLLSLMQGSLRDKNVRIFAGIALGSLILSFGAYLPGYEYLQHALPFLRVGRYPSMVLIVTQMYLLLWLASVVHSVRISRRHAHQAGWAAGVGAALAGMQWLWIQRAPSQWWTTMDALAQGSLSRSTFHTLARDIQIGSMLSENIFVVACVLSLGVWAVYKKKFFMLCLLMIFECWYSTQANFLFAPSHIYPSTKNAIVTVQQQDETLFSKLSETQYRALTRASNMPYSDFGSYWEALVVRAPFSDSFVNDQELRTYARLTNLRDTFAPDWHLQWNIRLINGYTALLPQDFAHIWQQADETPRINFISSVDPSIPVKQDLLKKWAVKYYLVDTSYPLYDEVFTSQPVATQGALHLYEIPGALPRFRGSDAPIEVTQVQEKSSSQRLTVDSPRVQNLIIADRYDEQWQARVNGTTQPVDTMDGMRSIKIPAGKSTVELSFVPVWFYRGLWISVVSSIVWLAAAIISTQKWSVLNRMLGR